MNTVLIAGASGVIGEAALARFAAADNWSAIGLSRRRPELQNSGRFQHIAVDLRDAVACKNLCEQLTAVTHVIYAAVSEQPGLVAGWRDQQQMQINLGMLTNLMEPLCEVAPSLQHVTVLQGAKAYGAHAGHRPALPARETAPRVEHDNFYWLQEDYLREKAQSTGFHWTIFRPQVVVGSTWGAAMNPMLAFAAYAAIRRQEGKPFSFPGGELQMGEIVDTGLLAEAFQWAATATAARNQTFNITNGDVCVWREVWPALANAFDVDVGDDEPLRLAEYLLARSSIWDEVVQQHGLRAPGLQQFLGESHHYADILLRMDARAIQRPMLLSTIKLRQAGFSGCRDSEQVLRRLIAEMKQRRLIP